MSDRWGSDPIAIRTLHIWALDQGQTDTALELIRQAHPELFEAKPYVDAGNVVQAIDTAHLLQTVGQIEAAGKLLQSVIAAFEVPYAVSEDWMLTGKAQALALLGKKQAAVTELRRRVDNGWRTLWRWDTELNPNFESLWDDPEFQAIIEFLRADMARQYKEVQAMEASGEIPLPPEGDTPMSSRNKSKTVGGASRGDYAQDVLYIAKEHMDVRRDCVGFAPSPGEIAAGTRLPHGGSNDVFC